ncbi:glycosyl hydrolase family 8 [Paenibacillus sp. HGF5]|uniref:glycosyl hydrolase family 8 n=1 Tax=Paenibacillus sp. HGF5 TaxID=908341 RepID=UPI0002071E42|nr:glycosyl hydrolase family 8 [Paenibacillus sp. HGF5]EGG36812.1 glycosyl hydrolase family 8 [Paenibacillus sp. HGF5]
MTNRISTRKKVLLAIIIVLALAGIVLIACWITQNKENPDVTAAFIEEHMTNDNGTIATYLKPAASENPDIVAGREALSESLGLWMQTAVVSGNRARFDDSVQLLTTYFLNQEQEPYIQWKLRPDGQSEVTTNALGDDLRILDALLNAFNRWGEEEYLQLAKKIGSALLAVQTEDYLVDYHDFARDESAAALSLVYIDLSALREMHNNGILSSQDYERYRNLLAHMPSDGVFYPKTFHIGTGQYEYDASVNLIDQLIVGIHLAEMNHPPTDLIAFLKGEFRQHQRLAGRYTRKSRKPDADYESPAVYGLAIILALQTKDLPWAQQLHERMLQLRDQDPAYPGGYVFDGNTHAFDNLFPLLAETLFEQSK